MLTINLCSKYMFQQVSQIHLSIEKDNFKKNYIE